MMQRLLSSALLGSVVATSHSPDCHGDQCAQPRAHTQANSLLQIAKGGKVLKVAESAEMSKVRRSGAQWTEEEAMLVMGKIHYTLTRTGTIAETDLFKDYECMSGPGLSLPCNNSFNAYCHVDLCRVDNAPELDRLYAKYLRLGFHSCLPNEAGTGGCNGCLWFGTMFGKFTQLHGSTNLAYGNFVRSYENQEPDTFNNGMSAPADILEAIYTDKDFPEGTWPLDVSLKDSGKSRADLWAFAALVSAEFAMNTNNLRCKGEGEIQPECEHNYDYIPIEFPCEITVDKPPTFMTGRTDCGPDEKPADPATSSAVPHRYRDYESKIKDVSPATTMNGTQISAYMKTAFGYSYQETVAIMGAHSVGGFKFWHSFYKYNWQRGNSHMMNNNYYRIMMGKPAMFLSCGIDGGQPATAAGKPGRQELAETGWWLRPLMELKTGGPFLWFHYYHRCPACYTDDAGAWVSVEMRGNSKFQSTECCACNAQTEAEVDPECYVKVTQDETAISTDMGLYYQFEVGANGIPMNCPGTPVDSWNAERMADVSLDHYSKLNGGINTWDTEPSCTRNTAKEAGDEKSLSDYVELYATNQNVWAKDFFAAFEKMLHTGYAAGELVEGPQVLGIGRATCGQIKLTGKRGWNYGCGLGDNVKVAKPRPRSSKQTKKRKRL